LNLGAIGDVCERIIHLYESQTRIRLAHVNLSIQVVQQRGRFKARLGGKKHQLYILSRMISMAIIIDDLSASVSDDDQCI
jgi:hypothetical protein